MSKLAEDTADPTVVSATAEKVKAGSMIRRTADKSLFVAFGDDVGPEVNGVGDPVKFDWLYRLYDTPIASVYGSGTNTYSVDAVAT